MTTHKLGQQLSSEQPCLQHVLSHVVLATTVAPGHQQGPTCRDYRTQRSENAEVRLPGSHVSTSSQTLAVTYGSITNYLKIWHIKIINIHYLI